VFLLSLPMRDSINLLIPCYFPLTARQSKTALTVVFLKILKELTRIVWALVWCASEENDMAGILHFTKVAVSKLPKKAVVEVSSKPGRPSSRKAVARKASPKEKSNSRAQQSRSKESRGGNHADQTASR
jgi:hypothetical protein